ncbi:MFS transporter [Flagellatimonas centrodinii]|uniref:MFS transporter n=1 Tax=Flagellatimonas centrodinii TaxID=2806210 RepID=UPI001FEE4EDA|nr:MFS transporter [Flagellatimonas centrodinii]ULQ46100.1 MFS transporter [Flagellatimonas centrodinii]
MNDHRRAQWSWAIYDWGNSAFATTVMAGFFPIFFNEFWAVGVAPETQTLYQGLTSTVASLFVMLTAPWFGTLADRHGRHKHWLAAFTVIGVVTTAALFLVGRGQWGWAVVLSIIGRIGFFGGLSFYDALLTRVAAPDERDRVSALGYGLGYLGGGVLFSVNVMMALKPAWFGLPDAAWATRIAFLSVAIWWAVFSLPLFLRVPAAAAQPGGVSSWTSLRETARELRAMPAVWMFLLAYWLYIDGVDTIIIMAVDFGMKLGLPSESLIKALLLVQFIGFPAAIIFGRLGDRLGTRNALLLALAVYIGVTLWAYTLQTEGQFYAMAAAIGCVQGGIQSLSRAYFSRLIPVEQAGKFFGFYNMLGKFAAVLGPLVVGLTAQFTGNPRLAILSLLVFFVAGAALLWRADRLRGASA